MEQLMRVGNITVYVTVQDAACAVYTEKLGVRRWIRPQARLAMRRPASDTAPRR
jgi:hypothetical protein